MKILNAPNFYLTKVAKIWIYSPITIIPVWRLTLDGRNWICVLKINSNWAKKMNQALNIINIVKHFLFVGWKAMPEAQVPQRKCNSLFRGRELIRHDQLIHPWSDGEGSVHSKYICTPYICIHTDTDNNIGLSRVSIPIFKWAQTPRDNDFFCNGPRLFSQKSHTSI